MSIINMVFALASRVNTQVGPEARELASARYCTRALELLNNRRTPCISFESLQANLMVAEYLHSIHPEQCWMHVGSAIRIAQSLGLHDIRRRSRANSARAQTLAHRVWKLCVIWDRISCMTYGRQLIISRKEADAISMSSEEHLSEPADVSRAAQAEQTISKFLDRVLELYSILSRGLDDFAAWDLGLADPTDTSTANAPFDRVIGHERLLSNLEALSSTCDSNSPLSPGLTDSQKLERRLGVILHQRSVCPLKQSLLFH